MAARYPGYAGWNFPQLVYNTSLPENATYNGSGYSRTLQLQTDMNNYGPSEELPNQDLPFRRVLKGLRPISSKDQTPDNSYSKELPGFASPNSSEIERQILLIEEQISPDSRNLTYAEDGRSQPLNKETSNSAKNSISHGVRRLRDQDQQNTAPRSSHTYSSRKSETHASERGNPIKQEKQSERQQIRSVSEPISTVIAQTNADYSLQGAMRYLAQRILGKPSKVAQKTENQSETLADEDFQYQKEDSSQIENSSKYGEFEEWNTQVEGRSLETEMKEKGSQLEPAKVFYHSLGSLGNSAIVIQSRDTRKNRGSHDPYESFDSNPISEEGSSTEETHLPTSSPPLSRLSPISRKKQVSPISANTGEGRSHRHNSNIKVVSRKMSSSNNNFKDKSKNKIDATFKKKDNRGKISEYGINDTKKRDDGKGGTRFMSGSHNSARKAVWYFTT